MAVKLTLSGTVDCPACRPGTYQPGFLGTCRCVGTYLILAKVSCEFDEEEDDFVCTKSTKIVGIAPAVCKCNNNSVAFQGNASSCGCSKADCKPAKIIRIRKTKIT